MSKFLTDAHFQEWVKSGVAESLIRLNVKSVSGDSAYSHLLYSVPDTERRNDGRLSSRLLHRYRHLDYGGWWCSGIDVLTGNENEWGCLKPDRPRTPHQKNKPLKYEHPEGVSTDIFAFQVPDDIWELICEVNRTARDSNDFWQWVAQHPTIPIFITEGAKKAGALLSAGYVAIGLPGVNNGFRSDGISHALIPQLTHFSQRFREFVFAFDRDKKFKTRQMVTHATLTMGRLFQELGSKSTVLDWDARFGKGIDDVIVSQPEGFLDELIDDRLALAEFENKGKKKAYYLDSVELVDFMEGEFEDRFSFDEIKGEVLLDGEPLVISAELKVWFIKQFGYRCSTDDLLNTIAYMAKQNRFNPVQEYLKSVRLNADRIPINNLADRYFGATHPIYSTFIKKWLIGAVARAFSPGCQMDYCLVLKGEQRIGKSSFFQVLGGPWFDDSITDVTKEDSLLILYSCWIQELAELENVTTKRAAGEVKPFITRRNDRFRQKYDREISEHPRRSVLCATVNKTSFLADDTGNTRFLIVPIPKVLGKLNKALFEAERDALWASAVDAYFAGEKWELTLEEEIFSEQNNKMFDIPDEWESNIEHYLSDKELCSVAEILSEVFHFEPGKQDRGSQMRVASILGKMGWEKAGKATLQGRRQKVWKCGVEKNDSGNSEKGGAGGTGGTTLDVEQVPDVPHLDKGGTVLRKGGTVSQNGADTKLNSVPPQKGGTKVGQPGTHSPSPSQGGVPPVPPFSIKVERDRNYAALENLFDRELTSGQWVRVDEVVYRVEKVSTTQLVLWDAYNDKRITIDREPRRENPNG